MPSGLTHDRITLWTLPWIVGITYGFTRNGEVTLILSGGFLFSGLMFGPDLDIHSIQYKRWGFLKGIWLPYRNFLRHRSIFSHGLIIGTCVRVLYLFLIVAFVSIFWCGDRSIMFWFYVELARLCKTKIIYTNSSIFRGNYCFVPWLRIRCHESHYQRFD